MNSQSLGRDVLRLAIPSIVSNITVPLLSLVDIAIAGHMGNALSLAAIGVGAMVFNVIYWLFGFLRMGGSGLTAQAYGASDRRQLCLLRLRTLCLGCGIGGVLILLFWPLRQVSLWLMQADAEVLPFARAYFNICIFGAPAVLGSFALNGWMIGMQNTRYPAFVAVAQNVMNILLSSFFVFVLHLDLPGIALGTLLAQWAGFFLLFVLSCRLSRSHGLSLGSSVPTVRLFIHTLFCGSELRLFFSVNRDIFLRTLCLVAVNLYFTSASSAQGPLILAANTVLMTFFTLFSYFMDGFAYAAEALAGKLCTASRSFHGKSPLVCLEGTLLRCSAVMLLVFTVSYLFGSDFFISLLTDDSAVRLAASSYKFWTLLIPMAGVWAFVYDGLFVGLTRTREMLLSTFVGAVAFFLLIILLSSRLANHALWLALIAYLLLRGIVLKAAFRKCSP